MELKSSPRKGPKLPVRFAVITISDTRTKEEDATGAWLCEQLPRRGFEVVQYSIVGEQVSSIRTAVQTIIHGNKVDILITIGGTGITDRDCVPEALETLVEKRLDGFGELFRAISFKEVGPAAMFSRAFAGRIGRSIVFCIPAARRAAELALDRLIVPEMDHLMAMIKGH
jgi:molybdenum cofactor biosynthesis protein B